MQKTGVLDPREPFDVVYTWVNHADKGWQRMHARATNNRAKPDHEHASADDPARYTNRGELYWSIRSVRKYAPWVRRIYIVTNCALPQWVEGMPDVMPVSHDDVFQDSGALPTFNSHAIECVLHRIPGVSERFLYFNDDFFLCREVSPDDFFWGGQGVFYTLSRHDIPYQQRKESWRPVDSGAINSGRLLARDFNFTPIKKLQHAPYPLSVAILTEIESRYAEYVNLTRSRRFRSAADIAMATTLHAYYAHCIGLGRPSALSSRYIDISDWRFLALVLPLSPLWRGKFDTLCLNEVCGMRYGERLRDSIVRALMRRLFSQ